MWSKSQVTLRVALLDSKKSEPASRQKTGPSSSLSTRNLGSLDQMFPSSRIWSAFVVLCKRRRAGCAFREAGVRGDSTRGLGCMLCLHTSLHVSAQLLRSLLRVGLGEPVPGTIVHRWSEGQSCFWGIVRNRLVWSLALDFQAILFHAFSSQ